MEQPVNNTEENIYHLAIIDQFCSGNPEQVKKMVIIFMEQASQSVNEMKSAYMHRDFVSIKRIAHKLKPTITYYGIATVEETIRAIEIVAEQELAAELRPMIEKMGEVISRVIEKMKTDFLLY
jgi:HPt (histidine-containing phosphotransfer) domain-containing protein